MRVIAGLIGVVLCWGPVGARADDLAKDGWQFSIAPYLWATSLNGDATVKGHDAQVDVSFIDILKKSDSLIGLEGRMEAWNGNWGAYFDGVYARISASANPIGQVSIDAIVKLEFAEAGLLYRFGQWSLGGAADQTDSDKPLLTVEGYVGARYTHLGISLDIDDRILPINRDASQEWVDPLVGARATLDLDDQWQLILGSDIGGFGAGSDLTWSAIGLVGYRFKLFGLDATSVIGYKALYQDYEHGNGTNAFKWDMTVHGPITATIIRF